MANDLFVTKPVDALVADTEESEHQLRRAVGALDLTALGLGAIIGTGIFVVIGEAIGDAALRSSSRSSSPASAACSRRSASPSWRPRSRWPGARTPTPTRRRGSWSRGSSAGT